MRSFESWTYEDVEIEFGIERVYESKLLNEWLETETETTDSQKESLEILKINLLKNIDALNEDELKMLFIAPLLNIVNFVTDRYKPFTQRSMTLKTEKVETSGIVDLLIATGKVRPKEPFFFLHEYKSQHPSKKNDPMGQLLIAMVSAQLNNSHTHPIYGILVEGRDWYFVILNNKEYAASRGFDACTNDIYQIYALLCKVKDYIEEILMKIKG
ncbi:MAG: hypothetical protein H7A23_02075 [Leptospiraceae bacterium]|nr:hypothetical protein [Leptospiraceae bacterium]MCP5493317.1 hypothetical protein [Leptospiraceae bacterium]